ncbi:SGNH/GDSL hydrolase family protein [Arenibacter sp. M-2]|uniref:SGNH/GDSL hydrolase family protein n=1 Tax=Arenibacter sp. M-2 TaxID=3053612 RepID=UPI0025704DFC|nr:SGNH/GDSL hydrolase family protein [Arenibacter sp. M-2]MDL5514937.1 SGNH/GDSL hydrolase family protein [Arenibacter sp. M-2]
MKKTLLKIAILTGLLFGVENGYGQGEKRIQFHSADTFTLVGKIKETEQFFHRIDPTDYPNIPNIVKTRLLTSAGMAISFKTNSKAIYAKWCSKEQGYVAHMSPLATRGLDLYTKENGAWQFIGVGRPDKDKDCSSKNLVNNLDGEMREYLLYLPLYSETTSVNIGVGDGATIVAGRRPFEKRILVYGSSIVHGASASRPGMAYTSRLSRETGLNFLNLGMSGVARMEKEVAHMASDIPADAYILDCVPNSSPEQITERTAYLIKTIRKKHKAVPIIVMQSVIREHGYFNRAIGDKVARQNHNIYKEVQKLYKEGFENLYFIFADDFLGNDHEGTVDGTHPNDLGFDRMLQVIKLQILPILNRL